MRTNYIKDLMNTNFINKRSAHAHKFYYSSHAQDYFNQRFCSCAQFVLEY